MIRLHLIAKYQHRHHRSLLAKKRKFIYSFFAPSKHQKYTEEFIDSLRYSTHSQYFSVHVKERRKKNFFVYSLCKEKLNELSLGASINCNNRPAADHSVQADRKSYLCDNIHSLLSRILR